MSKKEYSKTRKQFRIPVLGLMLGLAVAEAGTNGAISHAITGNWTGAKSRLSGAVSEPVQSAKRTIGPAVGLAAYSMLRTRFRPGINVGPVRIEA